MRTEQEKEPKSEDNIIANSASFAQNFGRGPPADGTGGILRVTQHGSTAGTGIIGTRNSLNKYLACGIHNYFGIDFDPVTGKLWETEDGPNFNDELNYA
jgi:glucose/arabinose dehydrogenase